MAQSASILKHSYQSVSADSVNGCLCFGSGGGWIPGRISFTSFAVHALHVLWPLKEPCLHRLARIVSL